MKVGISLPVRELKDDVGALKAFAQAADDLGLTHLRVPDQVARPGSGHLHEPLALLAFIAAVTTRIELVPSVVIAPSRQTVLLAKQLATIDRLSGGRVRLGVGVGGSRDEYESLGEDFHTRGRRCSEQMVLMRRLWTEENVDFEGEFDRVTGNGINPLPTRSIPIWIGASGVPAPVVARRIGELADGWFALCSPEEFPEVKGAIDGYANGVGRDPAAIGIEAGVAVVGPRQAEWRDRVVNWEQTGLTHLCLRTLGGGIDDSDHIPTMEAAVRDLPVENG